MPLCCCCKKCLKRREYWKGETMRVVLPGTSLILSLACYKMQLKTHFKIVIIGKLVCAFHSAPLQFV